MSQDNHEKTMIEAYVRQLTGVFERMPVAGETAPADREAIRSIGQQIYDSDIPRGMRKVADCFAQRMPQHARRLDMLWDGVGSWMG